MFDWKKDQITKTDSRLVSETKKEIVAPEQVHFRTEPHFEKFYICQKAILAQLLFISSKAPFAFRNRVGLARKREKINPF